jgi:hypothetical protein
MSFTNGKDQPFWGLKHSDNLWFELRYHLVILFFTILQMGAYEHLSRREKEAAWYGLQQVSGTIT